MEPIVCSGCQRKIAAKLATCPYCRASSVGTSFEAFQAAGTREGESRTGLQRILVPVIALLVCMAIMGVSLALKEDVAAHAWITWCGGVLGWAIGIASAVLGYRLQGRAAIALVSLLGGVFVGSFASFGFLRLLNGAPSADDAERVPCVVAAASVRRTGTATRTNVTLECTPASGEAFSMKFSVDEGRVVEGARVRLPAKRGRLGVWVSDANRFVDDEGTRR